MLETLRREPAGVIEKRRSPRMRICLPVLLAWTDRGSEKTEQAYSLSISWFGCTVHSREFFKLGQSIRLSRGEGKAIDAAVIYCLADHENQMVEVGLKFDRDGRKFWEMPAWKE